MRILFAGKQHYDPGGIAASTDQLARVLGAAGHDVAVLAHAEYSRPRPPEAERRTVRREPAFDYEAYSIDLLPPDAGLAIVMRWFRPDVLVVNAGGRWWHDWTRALVWAAPRDVPLLLYIRDHSAVELVDELAARVDSVLVNAGHHADSAARHGVTALVVPSLVDTDRYRTDPTDEAVVFINPVVSKGVETAFALAEHRRDIPFHFRESWHLSPRLSRNVADRSARLGNVEFLVSTRDPIEVYRRARLLLVPYEDHGRPRVVAEAQASGIPILARDDPALREAVGPGGILVPPDAPFASWLDALDLLWDDDVTRRRYGEAALRHSRREEMRPDWIGARFVDALVDAVDRHNQSGAAAAAGPRQQPDADENAPLASVIVPVRNVMATIDEQMSALTHQSYSGSWEVVVADNGSTDETRARVESWRGALPALTVVDASRRRGVAHARNTGIRAARGQLILICDGDDVVAPHWLEHIVSALEKHPIVTGFIDIVTMNRVDQYGWTGDAAVAEVPVGYGYLPYAPGGNIGMWRDVFDVLAGFDETLLRAEDIDFAWRAHYLGIPVHFEPRAVLHRRLRDTPTEFRAGIRGGMAEPALYRRHRDRGMPRASRNEVVRMYRWLVRATPGVALGRGNRHHWAHHAGKRIGRMVGSVRHRVLYL